MAWVRLGDEAGMHEVVLAPLDWDDAPPEQAWLLLGVMTRAVTFVAMHQGDYLLRRSKFMQAASPADWRPLWRDAIRAGYGQEVQLEDGSVAMKLIEDKTLFHMISREARERNNQHRNDTRDSAVRAAVKLRDGDECRWCGRVVEFEDHRSIRSGKYCQLPKRPAEHLDHLGGRDPRGKPTPADKMVVSCRNCNQSRQDDRAGWNRPLLPVPRDPFYSQNTAAFIKKWLDIDVEPSEHRTPTRPITPTPEPPPRSPDPDPEPERELAVANYHSQTGTRPEPDQKVRHDRNCRVGTGTGRAGPGRDGTGQGRDRAGTGAAEPSPPEEYPHAPKKRKRRNRKRGRG